MNTDIHQQPSRRARLLADSVMARSTGWFRCIGMTKEATEVRDCIAQSIDTARREMYERMKDVVRREILLTPTDFMACQSCKEVKRVFSSLKRAVNDEEDILES